MRTELDFLTEFYGTLLNECGISPVLANVPESLSVSRRIGTDGSEYYFILNLTPGKQIFRLPFPLEDIWNKTGEITKLTLPPSGSTVLKRKQ